MTVLSIVEFLRERLDEDEEAAKAVSAPYRLYVYDDGQVREPEIEHRADSEHYGTYRRDADGDDVLPNRHSGYALLYDPARVLREVEAKRAILVDHSNPHAFAAAEDPSVSLGAQISRQALGEWCEHHEAFTCTTLRDLAAVYQDHPDWREEWRPTS